MSGPKPLDSILQITPYKGGESLAGAHKLSSNENPFGCSPLAKAAMEAAGENLATYPDGGATALRGAIAARYGLDADRIVCGAGSDEIFQFLARAYLSPGDEILQNEHGFLVYQLVAQQAGATTISAPETDYRADIDALLERVTPRTKIVFLANPNNPTGTYVPYSEVKRLHAGLPENVLLVLDGAYAEYVRVNDYAIGTDLAGEMPNVLMTRTFSKIHGLAGLRLGWAYGPASVIDAINRVRGPFNVSSVAQAAGIASLSDDAFLTHSADHNAAELARMFAALSALGLDVTPSVGNFLLIHFGQEAGKTAQDADRFMRSRKIVLRALGAYKLPNALRYSIGTQAANDAVLEAFTDFMTA